MVAMRHVARGRHHALLRQHRSFVLDEKIGRLGEFIIQQRTNADLHGGKTPRRQNRAITAIFTHIRGWNCREVGQWQLLQSEKL